MRLLLSQSIPPFDRVLLVESGSRHLVEDLLDGLYDIHPKARLDLVTCYPGLPKNYREDRGAVYRTADYPDPASRKKLFEALKQQRYTVLGILCSGEPIMTKWKWAIVWHVSAKMFILNENGDYFWLDYSNWRTVRHFVLFRTGLAGGGAVATLARLAMFPFTLAYLLLYAAAVHLRRRQHLSKS